MLRILFLFLIFTTLAFANVEDAALLRQVLFGQFPTMVEREEIDRRFEAYIDSQRSDPKTEFKSVGERAYWESKQYPRLWEELCTTLDRELERFIATGIVNDELRFVVGQLYFFGHLICRPIYLSDGQTIDETDQKLSFSVPVGTACEVVRFIRTTGAKRVCEIFTGRGNLTCLLSISGFDELYTVEKDTYLNLMVSWKESIDAMRRELPVLFWPKVVQPIFIQGDIFTIELPNADCAIMDPPYGYASTCYTSAAQALFFFLDLLEALQWSSLKQIYSLVPAEWNSILRIFPSPNRSFEIDQILQSSIYYQRKPYKRSAFLRTIQEENFFERLDAKTKAIRGLDQFKQAPIQNVLGKELDIFQMSCRGSCKTQVLSIFGFF